MMVMVLPSFTASSRSWLTKTMVQCIFSCSVEQLVLQAGADQRVERRERLVHQQDLGVGGEGAGEADALLHAAGELGDALLGPVLQVDGGEHLARLGQPLGLAAMPASSSPSATFSTTLRQGSSANCWNTIDDRAAAQPAQPPRRRR